MPHVFGQFVCLFSAKKKKKVDQEKSETAFTVVHFKSWSSIMASDVNYLINLIIYFFVQWWFLQSRQGNGYPKWLEIAADTKWYEFGQEIPGKPT